MKIKRRDAKTQRKYFREGKRTRSHSLALFALSINKKLCASASLRLKIKNMATKKETYTEAMKRLEAIVSQIESNELDIDELANRLKEAQRLIKYCREKLYKADVEIKKMLEEGQDDEKNAE